MPPQTPSQQTEVKTTGKTTQSDTNLTNFFGNNPVASAVMVGSILIALSIFGTGYMLHGGFAAGNGTGGVQVNAGNNGQQPSPTTNVKVADRSDEPIFGSANAPVTVYEFGDFQCPFCKRFFQDSFATLKSKYIDTGKVKFIFRHFPLTQIHVNAEISSEAAECANRQGKFEDYYNILYTQGQGDGTGLDSASLKKYASQLGLNMATFNQCLDNHEAKAVVDKDAALGATLGVTGTPAFFINGQLVLGAQPEPVFEQTIDAALQASK